MSQKQQTKVYRAFSSPISHAWKEVKKNKKTSYLPIDISTIHEMVIDDINFLQNIAQYHYDSDKHLIDDVSQYKENDRNTFIGRDIGIKLPEWAKEGRKSGNSRLEEILRDMIVRNAKSELERIKAFTNTSDKYISQGHRRTASPCKSIIGKKISLSAVNKQYCEIINCPEKDGYIDVRIVINGDWYLLRFTFDNERFSDYTKICLPDISINKQGIPVFYFSVEYPYVYKEISSEYIVGVDVGISNYATVVVTNSQGDIVHASTLSEDVHSLNNSITATKKQVAYLHEKRAQYSRYSNEYKEISKEISLHRKANINKKKEIAIKAAQEIAYISYIFDNAVVSCEDLSWIRNNMQNGRWNRGELVKRLQHCVELNGGRIIKVNAYNTSQECYSCGKQVYFKDYHTVVCTNCGVVIDRDINAAANIANRARETVRGWVKTRKKSKKYQKDKDNNSLRTPITTPVKKKRGSSTTRKKNEKTGKCYNKKQAKQFYLAKQKFKEVKSKIYGTDAHNDDVMVSSDEQYMSVQDSQKATRNYSAINNKDKQCYYSVI